MGNVPYPERTFVAPAAVAGRVEELYTAHARLVRSVCRSLLRDRDEADDAVQQTFLSAQRALANGSTPREPAAWLATIARNECLARVRERMREPLPVDADPTELGADTHAAAVSRHEVATLRGALAGLPRAQREAIILRELRGLSYDEVARALSVTTAAVESLIFRARRTLQLKLSEVMTALSPVSLLGRLLGGESDVTGPVAAKVAVIGAGAALLAGGAALGPHAFGLGHAASKVQHAAAHAPVHVQAALPSVSDASAHIWSTPAPATAPVRESEREAPAASDRTSASDVAETSKPEASSPEKETESATVPTVTTVTTTPTAPPSTDGSSSGDSTGTDN